MQPIESPASFRCRSVLHWVDKPVVRARRGGPVTDPRGLRAEPHGCARSTAGLEVGEVHRLAKNLDSGRE